MITKVLGQSQRTRVSPSVLLGWGNQPYCTGRKVSNTISIRGPRPLGSGPGLVHGLLGTGPHSRRGAEGERVKLHPPLPIAPHPSHHHLNHPPHLQAVEKSSSTKPVPGAKKVGDH